MYISVAIFCTSVITENCTLSISGYNELRKAKIEELNSAAKLFDEYKIGYNCFKSEELIIVPDLIKLIEEQNLTVDFIEPDLEDYKYAHHKACLHLAPHPPDIKSDEMRDLILWSIALKIASENNGGLLISNDKLHLNPLGDEEASMVNLTRVNNLESASEYLEIETPNGKIIRSLLDIGWDKLIASDVPLLDKPSLKGISNVKFVQGNYGPTDIFFNMKAIGLDKKDFQTDMWMQIENNTLKRIKLDRTTYDGKALIDTSINLEVVTDLFTNDYEERFSALKTIFKYNL